jgi:hypothetical protein
VDKIICAISLFNFAKIPTTKEKMEKNYNLMEKMGV